MRYSEFWSAMDAELGAGYSRVWADTQSLTELNSRTVTEALNSGETPKDVWRAVRASLSPRER